MTNSAFQSGGVRLNILSAKAHTRQDKFNIYKKNIAFDPAYNQIHNPIHNPIQNQNQLQNSRQEQAPTYAA